MVEDVAEKKLLLIPPLVSSKPLLKFYYGINKKTKSFIHGLTSSFAIKTA